MINRYLTPQKGLLAGWLVLQITLLAPAQTRPAGTPLSLTAALELGPKNRYDIQAGQVSEALLKNAIDKHRNTWLRTVTASGNVRYNSQLQTTVVPAGLLPGNPEAQRIAFGTRNSTIFALDLTQPLYRPGAKTDLALLQNSGELDREKNARQQTNVKVKIAEAYLNVLLKELQRGVAQADERRNQTYFTLSEAKYKLGTLLESDWLTAQLTAQNSQLTAQKAEQNYRAAQARLCYELNIPTDTTLILTDRIDTSLPIIQQRVSAGTLPNRTELRQLRIQQERYTLQGQKVLDALRPGVSLYGNYSAQFLANSVNYGSDNWYAFNYVGLQVSVPLTGQFTKKTDGRTYQLLAQQTALTLKQTEADLTNEIRQAEDDLTNAARNLQSTQGSLLLSKQLSQLQQEQYRFGTVLYRQFLDTEASLQTAQQNYLEAAYNYLIAKLTYEKAIGLY